ncbi:MAG: type IV pilin protein [Burkholderiales bacterium]
MRTTKGFTLLELLTVVGIIAILGAISVPFYNDYVTRSKITEATSALSDGRVKLEQFFQDNRTYTGGPAPTSTTYFTYAVGGASTTAYTLTATGIGSMAGFTYTINEANTRSTTAAPSGWAAASMPTSCWIVRKGGKC